VVSCVPPWVFEPSCTTTAATANATALHTAPCLDNDAGVFAFGDAASRGAPRGALSSPITAMEATGDGNGYWLVSADGGVFSYGNAPFLGSLGNLRLQREIVDFAVTRSGAGYWLVGADGGVFCFGDAKYRGGIAPFPINAPVVGIASTRSGRGYWIVAADGGVFCFGDATFHGSTGNLRLAQPVVGIASTPTGRGYWLVAADGGVFCFGDAEYHGSLADDPRPHGRTVDVEPAPGRDGYWITTT
jgi:hypothetical protein